MGSDVSIRIQDDDSVYPYPGDALGTNADVGVSPYRPVSQYPSYGTYGYGMPYAASDMEGQEQIDDIEFQKRRWKNRRYMAWSSLASMIAVTLVLLFAPVPESRLKILSEPIIWSYFAFTSVIGAYMGFTTWASRK